MPSDDICGAETGDGEPCQNPASEGEHCWIDAHGGDVSTGRPSKLDDHEDDVLDAARQGMTLEGCARVAGIDESTLHRWKNDHAEFRKSLRRARAKGERKIVVGGLTDEDVDTSMARFLLERSFGYTKTQEIEHTGDGFDLSLSSDEKEMLDDQFDEEPQS